MGQRVHIEKRKGGLYTYLGGDFEFRTLICGTYPLERATFAGYGVCLSRVAEIRAG